MRKHYVVGEFSPKGKILRHKLYLCEKEAKIQFEKTKLLKNNILVFFSSDSHTREVIEKKGVKFEFKVKYEKGKYFLKSK